MAEDKTFLGTGWAFPPSFDPDAKAVAMVSAEDDIRQSLHILFRTTPGERVMQPSYGCDLRHLIFEDIDENTLTDIKDMITKAVLFFEVRIILNEVLIDDGEWIDGLLNVTIDYTIRGANTRNNIVFPLYLREGSGVGHQA
jgi:hypothetical protein